MLFTNPAAPLTGRALEPPPVLPLDDTQRVGLLGRLNEPGEWLIVLLAGVHAVRPSQICALTLDDADPAASTLRVCARVRPLDQLTTGQPAAASCALSRRFYSIRQERRPAPSSHQGVGGV